MQGETRLLPRADSASRLLYGNYEGQYLFRTYSGRLILVPSTGLIPDNLSNKGSRASCSAKHAERPLCAVWLFRAAMGFLQCPLGLAMVPAPEATRSATYTDLAGL